MIHVHKHPICEYDEDRNAIIRAADFLEKCLPEKCVITFFRKELEQFVQEHNLPIIGYLHSEVLDIPIYNYEIDDVILNEANINRLEGYYVANLSIRIEIN